MHNKWYIIILLGLGLLTRFIFFGHPNETVFDEVHFGKFISAYYSREFYFDIHPALGKQIIAGFSKLAGFKPEYAFAEIGEKFPNNQYKILRFLPSFTSSILPFVIFLILMEMRLPPLEAFFGGLLLTFENAYIAQGRFILMDSFMLLFGFLSLLFYLKYHNRNSNYWLLATGFFSGLALSIKWIALSFIAIPLAVETASLLPIIWNDGLKFVPFKKIGKAIVSLLFIPLAVYFLVFVIEFSILTKSGPGDPFMMPGFRKTLASSEFEKDPNIKASNVFQKFLELNTEMYKANQRLDATHPYSSQWYTWPLMTRPIYYWVGSDETEDQGRIYFIGNPFIWWLSTVGLIFGVTYRLVYFKEKELDKIFFILLGGYLLNLLPFIGVKRVMFLYHYLTAYIFAIMILAYLISQNSSTSLTINKNPKKIMGVFLALAVVFFIYFAPLSYGTKLNSNSYENRVWISSWR